MAGKNVFEVVQTLCPYPQDLLISKIIVEYKAQIDHDISFATIRRQLLQPVSRWRFFTDYFLNILSVIIAADARQVFEAAEKEEKVAA